MFTQFRNTGCYTSNCKHAIGSRVPCLLKACCPSCIEEPSIFRTMFALSATVIACLIWPAINFQFLCAFSKIGNECSKRIPPSIANNNAFGTVFGENHAFRIVAPLDHTSPRLISNTLGHAVMISNQASAGFSVSRQKTPILNNEAHSAFTFNPTPSAKCSTWMSDWRGFGENKKPFKCLAYDVFLGRHNGYQSTVFASGERLTSIRRSLRFLTLRALKGQ